MRLINLATGQVIGSKKYAPDPATAFVEEALAAGVQAEKVSISLKDDSPSKVWEVVVRWGKEAGFFSGGETLRHTERALYLAREFSEGGALSTSVTWEEV